MIEKLYNSEEELLKKGKILEGKSLSQLHFGKYNLEGGKDKGKLGKLVEEIHYGIKNNNRSEPDVPNLGIEIKTNPIGYIKSKKAYGPIQPVKLGMIDFDTLIHEEFETSYFVKKNKKILFNMYEENKDMPIDKNTFLLVDIIDFFDEDKEVIKRDWEHIKNRVKSLNAGEMSSTETNYLVAKIAGDANSENKPYANGKAYSVRKAFYFHARYIREKILTKYEESKNKKGEKVLIKKAKTTQKFKLLRNTDKGDIKGVVISKFKNYIGKKDFEIASIFGEEQKNKFVLNTDKSRWHWNTSLILVGKRKKYLYKYIDEFSKIGLTVKTIRVDESNLPLEEISFKTQDYNINRDSIWEESSLYEEFSNPFLWVIYKKTNSLHFNLDNVFFWNMDENQLSLVEKKWYEFKNLILTNDFRRSYFLDDSDSFYYLKIKDSIGGQNKIFRGSNVTSLSHWIRKDFVQNIIKSHIKD